MRIALIIEHLAPHRGGRETSTAQIAAALAGRRHGVTVLCQSADWGADGVDVRRLGRRGRGRAAGLANFVIDVRAALRDERFDVSHAMLPIPGVNIYQPRGGTAPAQVLAAGRRRRKIARGLWRLGRPFNLHRRCMLKLEQVVAHDHNTLCLAGSEMVAREFAEHFGRVRNVRVVFNAVDVPTFSDEQRTEARRQKRGQIRCGEDETVFLTVAKNFDLKGVGFAIKAFAAFRRSRAEQHGAHLVLLGREKFRPWRRLAGRLGVGNCVHFVPPTPEIFEWYSAADVCVLLSWYDACSRVVLEATRWGIPSITTTYNGAAEVLAPAGADRAGIVVQSPRDIAAVVSAMSTLARPQTRSRYVLACRAAAERLTMKRHVNELLEQYAKCCKARQPDGDTNRG